MNTKSILIVSAIVAIGFSSCVTSAGEDDLPASFLVPETLSLLTATPPPFTATPRLVDTPTGSSPQASPTEAAFIFAEPGPNRTGYRSYSMIDENRADREIRVTIWYPAVKPDDAENSPGSRDAPPNLEGAPYPVVMTGRNSGDYLYKSHLASHGFAMVIVRSPGFSYTAPWNNAVIDAPLDFLFVLDRLTSDPPAGLEGVLDTDRVGVAGYSSDGLFSLALGGARINPEYYLSQCAQASSVDPSLSPFLIEYYCTLSERWDEFSSQVGAEISTLSEGLWQPTTDKRIQAFMPMAPDSAWLYGAEGLAAIKIPALIIAGTTDDLVSYRMTSCYVYEHLVNADRSLISFIGRAHMMVENREVISRIDHFTVAFFGYYLQGRREYADYFSEETVSQYDDLFWGVYPED